MHKEMEFFAGICFLVIGLSHILQSEGWVEFFAGLGRKGSPGAFAEGFLCLGFGAFVVAFHNVWSGPPVILTLVGWLQILKGLLRFTAPQPLEEARWLAGVLSGWHRRWVVLHLPGGLPRLDSRKSDGVGFLHPEILDSLPMAEELLLDLKIGADQCPIAAMYVRGAP